ncbi:MAG: L7Ae/L30e/S12e/Gadd45 family ribosomal protein [Bacilli bacterium]
MQSSILNLLGLARRANKIAFGDNVLPILKTKKHKFIIIAIDASDNTKKRWIDKCNFYQSEYVIYATKDLLGKSIGMNDVAVIGLFEPKLIAKVKSLLKEGDVNGTK